MKNRLRTLFLAIAALATLGFGTAQDASVPEVTVAIAFDPVTLDPPNVVGNGPTQIPLHIFDRLVDDAREARRPMALLICDLDYFKRINDTHGHLVGDECLRHAARRLLAVLEPEQALVARFGGEEFVAVLPGTDQDQALRIAERLRATDPRG